MVGANRFGVVRAILVFLLLCYILLHTIRFWGWLQKLYFVLLTTISLDLIQKTEILVVIIYLFFLWAGALNDNP